LLSPEGERVVGFSVKSLLFLGFTGAASFSANMLLPEVEIEAFCASSLLLMADREGFSGLFALVPTIGTEGFIKGFSTLSIVDK